ncbi:hypothetical protein Bhyg_02631 [Pseudolycoriella hygida]|uniref:Uncharacterized protein n=1 Tax=Pseudolycoriella hygida TaxID=35572 RepID=A0A9Q0S6U2_9DIPT|nr:hypothetical protein Bhyg_02631 [Pseudolycoriella hygida]
MGVSYASSEVDLLAEQTLSFGDTFDWGKHQGIDTYFGKFDAISLHNEECFQSSKLSF